MERREYRSDGRIEARSDYAPLSAERRAGLFIDASLLLEGLMERLDGDRGALQYAQVDGREFYRTVTIDVEGFEDPGDRPYYVKPDGSLVMIAPIQATRKRIDIEHVAYKSGPLEESYRLGIERYVPGVEQPFYLIYDFEYFKGGGVQASMVGMDVTVDSEVVGGNSFTREMLEYDADQFEKEVHEIAVYAAAAMREKYPSAT